MRGGHGKAILLTTPSAALARSHLCQSLILLLCLPGHSLEDRWQAEWEPSEAEPGASLGSKFLLGCLTQLGQRLGCMCSGTSTPYGAGGRRGPRRDGAILWSWGCCGAWRPIPYLPGAGALCCLEATFTHSGEAVNPTTPSLHLSSGFSEPSASAVPEGVCPSCCRASPPPPGLQKRLISSQLN